MEEAKENFKSLIITAGTRKSPGIETECWWMTTKPEKTTKYAVYQSNYIKGLGMSYGHQASYYFFVDTEYRPSRQKPMGHLCEKRNDGEEVGIHRRCVNPNHLKWCNSIQDNIDDRDNTYQRLKQSGENCSTSTFTNEQARAIQKRHIAGEEYKDIALDFSCSRKTIEKICIGETYIDATGGDCRPIIEANKKARNKAIIEELEGGMSRKDIIAKYKISGGYITGLLKKSVHP